MSETTTATTTLPDYGPYWTQLSALFPPVQQQYDYRTFAATPYSFADARPGESIWVSASTGERDLARGGGPIIEGTLRSVVCSSSFRRRSSPYHDGFNRKQRRAARAAFLASAGVPPVHGNPLVPGRPADLGEERTVVSPEPEASPFRAGMSLPGVSGNYATIRPT